MLVLRQVTERTVRRSQQTNKIEPEKLPAISNLQIMYYLLCILSLIFVIVCRGRIYIYHGTSICNESLQLGLGSNNTSNRVGCSTVLKQKCRESVVDE